MRLCRLRRVFRLRRRYRPGHQHLTRTPSRLRRPRPAVLAGGSVGGSHCARSASASSEFQLRSAGVCSPSCIPQLRSSRTPQRLSRRSAATRPIATQRSPPAHRRTDRTRRAPRPKPITRRNLTNTVRDIDRPPAIRLAALLRVCRKASHRDTQMGTRQAHRRQRPTKRRAPNLRRIFQQRQSTFLPPPTSWRGRTRSESRSSTRETQSPHSANSTGWLSTRTARWMTGFITGVGFAQKRWASSIAHWRSTAPH